MATLTDVIVALICFYAYSILRKKSEKNKAVSFFKLYFLFMGFGMLTAGIIGHGFQYIFGYNWKLLGWLTSIIGLIFFERSSIEYNKNILNPKFYNVLLKFNILELIAVLSLTIFFLNFKVVQIHAAWGLLIIVLGFHIHVLVKTADRAGIQILIGVILLISTVFIFNIPITPHTWFNHIDLAHTIMAIASIFFLRGALKLKDPPLRKNRA